MATNVIMIPRQESPWAALLPQVVAATITNNMQMKKAVALAEIEARHEELKLKRQQEYAKQEQIEKENREAGRTAAADKLTSSYEMRKMGLTPLVEGQKPERPIIVGKYGQTWQAPQKPENLPEGIEAIWNPSTFKWTTQKIEDSGFFSGKSMDAQANKILVSAASQIRNGRKLTPEQRDAVTLSYRHLMSPKRDPESGMITPPTQIDEGLRRTLNLTGILGGRAEPDILLESPIPPEKTYDYISNKGEYAQIGTTWGDIQQGKYHRKPADFEKQRRSMNSAMTIMKSAAEKLPDVFKGITPETRDKQTFIKSWEAFRQTNVPLSEFEGYKGTLSMIIRAFGEVGTLNEGDVQRMMSMWPKTTPRPDTLKVAVAKLKLISGLMENSWKAFVNDEAVSIEWGKIESQIKSAEKTVDERGVEIARENPTFTDTQILMQLRKEGYE